MAPRASRMLPLGTPALPFALPDTVTGRTVSLGDFAGSPLLLVAFICNHCPFVKYILDGFVAFAREFGTRGLAVVAISPNDIVSQPDDAPGEMARIARLKGFTFPYLYDESQEVAKAYQAVCTPDFFLFNRDRRLAYRGQFDASRPGSDSGDRRRPAGCLRCTAQRQTADARADAQHRLQQHQMERRTGAGLDLKEALPVHDWSWLATFRRRSEVARQRCLLPA